ncbi:LacI family transcriptional regulator [Microbacterium sp. CBS5P-1]|nr:LacI family transcriptional regulator [Microbacterium excoecariae]
MKDVAERAGVSRQLVSLVMRDAAGPSDESRERILAAARELGYRPHQAARLLRQSRTRTIGILFLLRHPFQTRVVERLVARAAERGYAVALAPLAEDGATDAGIEQLMRERVEAIVAFNPAPSSAGLAEAIAQLPVAWLGEWAPGRGVDNVHVDEEAGLAEVVAHLAALGHTRIAYAGGRGGVVAADRADAYRRAMAGAGLADHAEVIAADFGEEGGAAAARTILARADRPTALVCAGDLVAAGALAVFARAGLQVPRDISVVGFDDSDVAALSYHRLTSVHQDVDATVEAALDCVVDRLADPGRPPLTIATPARLVVRETTGAPRGSRAT